MLRSKQLLPFAKGARAWIVAGSVSKPTPLDGSASSEDGKSEQGHNGTKSQHSSKSPLGVSGVEGSPYRGVPRRTGAPSQSTKSERIHQSPRTEFSSGPSLARRTVIASKDINDLIPSSAGKRLSGDNSGPASLPETALSAAAPERVFKSPESVRVLVSKADANGSETAYIANNASVVGLATLSHISDQGAVSKVGGTSKANASTADGDSGFLLARADSSNAVVHDNVAAPLKNIRERKTVESSTTAPNDPVPVHDSGPVTSAASKKAGRDIKKSLTSEESKGVTSASHQRISFGTVDPPVLVPSFQSNKLECEALSSSTSVSLKPYAGTGDQEEKYARPHAKGLRPETNGVIDTGGHGLDIFVPKSSGASKGRELRAGISGGRRKVHALGQAGGSRQSHRSAKDSGCERSSNEMISQVGTILKRMGWTPRTVDALADYNSKLTAFHINEVLKDQREPRLAREFFNWAKRQSGYKHDVRTYTTMIGILGRARDFEGCDSLMNDMRREGCHPSVVTFNRLIHSYGKANYLGKALNLFHHMQELGCEPDRVTYCTLIDLHSKAGFHDIAMDICHRMWQAGFEPDTYSYTLIIHCLGKAGNLPAAYKLFLEMIQKGCTPNLVTYNTMIDLHAKAGKYHMALKLYNDMQDSGFRPDNVTYSVIMDVLGHSGHMDEAENVFTEMEQAGWSADATNFGSLVYMWGQAGNVNKATEWYKRMLDSGLLPNVPTCNSLLWAYMQVNDYEAARQVLDSMPKWGLTPTLPTYTLLLSTCTSRENQHDVDATLEIMSRTRHPAHSFVCRLLNEQNSCESIGHVRRYFDSLHEEEHDLKRSFADALIEFLYKLDHKERAGRVWEVAMEKNFYPSAISQRSPSYWIVDLHVMSMGTAVVALLRTLSSFRERMLSTGEVPDRIEIVTGWGKHSRVSGFSKIKNMVENILGALHAPFYVDHCNVGCFVGSGQPLVDWLQSDMEHMLAL